MNIVIYYLPYLILLFLLAVPLGHYIEAVRLGRRHVLSPLLQPAERRLLACFGLRGDENMSAKEYCLAVLVSDSCF